MILSFLAGIILVVVIWILSRVGAWRKKIKLTPAELLTSNISDHSPWALRVERVPIRMCCRACAQIIEPGEPFLANYILCRRCAWDAGELFCSVASDVPLGATTRPRLAIDFDGVCSDYSGGWGSSDGEINGNPVAGLFDALRTYQEEYELWVHSVRCRSKEGRRAIMAWFERHKEMDEARRGEGGASPLSLNLCAEKPPAMFYLDDRGWLFKGPGTWPTMEELRAFKPWWLAARPEPAA